jgi:uncharacterized surface protein with fasciclin (FAS1) repeats
MKNTLVLALGLVSAISISSCMPAATPAVTPAPEVMAPKPAALGTIVDVAVGNKDFSTLVAALKAADLVNTLSGKGPFTVFAPTNAAFAKLPAGTVESLLKPENKATLVKILTYHVVSGKVESGTVVTLNGKKVGTVQTQEVTVNVKDGKVSLTDAVGGTSNVTAVDVQASNGVIHVIDTVLMPK